MPRTHHRTSVPEIIAISKLFDEHITTTPDGKAQYTHPHSDQSIADEVSLPVNNIAKLRRELHGKLATTVNNRGVKARLKRIEAVIAHLAREDTEVEDIWHSE